MQHPLSLLKNRNPISRMGAVRNLGHSGADASDLRILTELLSDSDEGVRVEVVRSLGRCGRNALPMLMQALEHADTHVRREATAALGKMGTAGPEAVPSLIRALGDVDSKIRMGAATALGRIGATAHEAIPQLIQVLCDTNLIFCRLAAQALSLIGVASVEPLTTALRHGDAGVRREAAWALGQIGPGAKASVAALSELLGNGEGNGLPATSPRPSANDIATVVINISPSKQSDETQVFTDLVVGYARESNLKVREAVAEALDRIQGKV